MMRYFPIDEILGSAMGRMCCRFVRAESGNIQHVAQYGNHFLPARGGKNACHPPSKITTPRLVRRAPRRPLGEKAGSVSRDTRPSSVVSGPLTSTASALSADALMSTTTAPAGDENARPVGR